MIVGESRVSLHFARVSFTCSTMIRLLFSKAAVKYGEKLVNTSTTRGFLKVGYQLYEWSLKFVNDVPRITVFRGISRDHPRYNLAQHGIVVPRNLFGAHNIDAHNYGSSKTGLTSWTRTRAVAETYAEPGGVILEATVPGNRILWSPDVWYENEVLMRGIICNAKVHLLASSVGGTTTSKPGL